MRIAVDALLYTKSPAGIGHYIGRLFTAYAARFNSDEVLAFLPEGQDIPGVQGFHPLPEGTSSARRLVFEQGQLPSILRRQSYDVVHFPDYQRPLSYLPHSVLTVHDLVAFKYPETFPANVSRVKQTLMRWSVPRADHIIVPSLATKMDLIDILKVPEERITVIWHGVQAPSDPVPTSPHPRPYFFFVGTLEPRKNLVNLIRGYGIFAEGRKDVPDLVIAGNPGWLYNPIYQAVARMRVQERVVFLGYVQETQVWSWYQKAVALCFPTLYEGFGMPVLEAMAVGCPVLTADRGAVREISEGIARWVDPLDPDSIAEGLSYIVSHPDEMAIRAAAGKVRAGHLTWTKAAEATRQVYEQVSQVGRSH